MSVATASAMYVYGRFRAYILGASGVPDTTEQRALSDALGVSSALYLGAADMLMQVMSYIESDGSLGWGVSPGQVRAGLGSPEPGQVRAGSG